MSYSKPNFLGQFIGGILNPRLNTADTLYKSGRPFMAISALKSVIWVLYNSNEHEKSQARSWMKEIHALEDITGSGHTKARREYERQRNQNAEAYRLYEEIIFNLWAKMHDRGYFTGNKAYGPAMKDINFSNAEIVG